MLGAKLTCMNVYYHYFAAVTRCYGLIFTSVTDF